jgi:Mn2+/Fe2+ NRAMP family transporter
VCHRGACSPAGRMVRISGEDTGRAAMSTSEPEATSSVRGATGHSRRITRWIGPGLVAGASDLDPTTVGAIAVIGATTVYGLGWLTLLLFPLLAVIQVIATRVGLLSQRDLQANAVIRFPRPARLALWASIVVVSVITIAADLDGGAAAIGLLVGADYRWFIVPLAAVLLPLMMLGSYRQVSRALRWVLVVLLGYGVAAVLAKPHWASVAAGSLVPRFHLTSDWTGGALALLGTTLTSYVFVWQTIEEAEERSPKSHVRDRQWGAVIGIGFTVVICWFILVATGATVGAHHLHVNTAQDAASALKPLAGRWATDVFAVALLASAAVALPVIVATCAYVTGAEFKWGSGLSAPIRSAPRFYLALATAVVAGVAIALWGFNPIRILFVASIIGGLAAPVGIVALLVVGADPVTMRGDPLPAALRRAGWAVAALISTASVVYLVQQLT